MVKSIVATFVLGIVFFLARKYQLDFWFHPEFGYMLAFFLGVSFLFHRLMEFGFKDQRDKFVQFYLSTVVARLILCIIFVGVYLYIGVENIEIFIANFFALYLFYTFFEIYGLYRNLRRDS